MFRRTVTSTCLAIGFTTIAMNGIWAIAEERVAAQPPVDVRPPVDARPLVQVAILLDTSNSMDGLIGQARTQLWKIVNEIGKFRRDGQMPRVQVALFEYGNNSIPGGEQYVRMVLPLTDNLDNVSEKLFALTTNGGDEYCGAVIQSAANGLKWDPDPKVYKSIFVCGNEPFTQGPIDYKSVIPSAFGKGIIVNTIHCGPRDAGVSGEWSAGADLGRGKFLNINQDKVVAVTVTPFDGEIQKLSVQLNVTYVPYGAEGKASAQRQDAQDKLAEANAPSGASMERAAAKASRNYNNAGWDLVDAIEQKQARLEEIPDKELPEAIQGKPLDEKKAYVEGQKTKRADIQKQIGELNKKREAYLAENAKGDAAKDTLDAALIEAVETQLKAQSYEQPK